jgi:TolB-like protein/Flp pilus assembly protein TadD
MTKKIVLLLGCLWWLPGLLFAQDSTAITGKTEIKLTGTQPLKPGGALTVEVTFGQAMDQTKQPQVGCGTAEPFNTHALSGKWTTEKTWQGECKYAEALKDGRYTVKVQSATTADQKELKPAETAQFFVDAEAPRLEQITEGEPSPANYTTLKITCRFSEPMDTTKPIRAGLGVQAPYNQYVLGGAWHSVLEWVGEMPVKKLPSLGGSYSIKLSAASDLAGSQTTDPAPFTFKANPFFSFYEAQAFFKEKQWPLAASAIEQFIGLEPDYGDAYVCKGRIAAATNKRDEALTLFKKALTLDPLNGEAAYLVGTYLNEQGHTTEAAPFIALALKLQNPGEACGQLKNARDDLFIYLTADYLVEQTDAVQTRDFYISLGVLKARQRMYDEALTYFKKAVELDGQSAACLYNAGTCHLALGQFDDAERMFSQALGVNDKLAPAHLNLGVLYALRDSADAALKEFVGQKGDKTWGAAAQVNAALLSARKGDPAGAAQVLTGANQADPRIIHNLAAVYWRMGEKNPGMLKKAQGLMPQLTGKDPVDPRSLCLTGFITSGSGDQAGAEKLFIQALALEPLFTQACYGLGQTYQKRAHYIAAQLWYQRALALDETYREVYAQLGVIYSKQGLKDKELAAYAKANDIQKKRDEKAKLANATVVAVGMFANPGNNQEFAWLRLGLAEATGSNLKRFSTLKVVDQLKVDKLLQEKMLAETGLTDAKGAAVGKELGAAYMITGEFKINGANLEMTARAIAVGSGKTAGTASAACALAALFDGQKDLCLKLVEVLGAGADQAAKKELAEKVAGSLEALRHASQGRAKYLQGDLDAALVDMRKAMELDNSYVDELSDMDLVSDQERMTKTLAVLEFKNSAGEAKYDWMKSGVSEALVTDLKKVTGLYLVERQQLNKAMDEINLGMTDLVADPAAAPKIGKMVGAGVVLLGSYQVAGDNVRIDARMVDVQSGAILMGETVQGPLDNIFELEQNLAFKIADVLNIAVSMAEREQIVRKANPTFNALRSIAIAQSALADQAQQKGARDLAVVRFKNRSAQETQRYDWIQAGIHELLTTEFRKNPGVKLVDQRVVEAQVGQQQMVRLVSMGSGPLDADLASRIPADYAVQGSYEVAGDQFKIEGRVIDVTTAAIVCAQSAAGSKNDPAVAEVDMAGKLLASFNQVLKEQSANKTTVIKPGTVPLWWGGSLTGVCAVGMGYFIYYYSQASQDYQAATSEHAYWFDRQLSAYRMRNAFIGATVTAAALTGGSYVWNTFLRQKFFKDIQVDKNESKVARENAHCGMRIAECGLKAEHLSTDAHR